jgi:hypothetical protein
MNLLSLCERTGHLIRITKTDRGSGDQYAHCQICGCAVVKGSWNTPWRQPSENVLKPSEIAIVKECARFANDYVADSFGVHYSVGDEIKKHFGIEDDLNNVRYIIIEMRGINELHNNLSL